MNNTVARKSVFTLLLSFVLTSVATECRLTFENDALSGSGDNDYTHGTCFEVVHGIYHFKVGQNMYAPSNLTIKEHIVEDRPYAGILYGGIGSEITFGAEPSRFTHYLEIDFGMIGPSAHCKEMQKFIHKILNCRDPQGWDNQLHDEFVVNAQWWTKYNWYICKYVALVPRVGIWGGTIQDAAEVGCDFKVGWNMKNDVGNQILLSSTRDGGNFIDKISAWLFMGCDERYYLYNLFLEGSLFNHKDDDLAVDIYPFVFEWRWGAVIKIDKFFAEYYMVLRGDEFRGQKNPPDYGGLVIGCSF